MHTTDIKYWSHDHTFGQDERRYGETRTLIVVFITAVTMVVEIAAGIAFGSMALLADGFHMGTHASALAISVFAYFYTRRHAKDTEFNFGTGKVNSLAAFASAVMLVLFAVVIAGESVQRFISPVSIGFNWAILVAVIGLMVNGICLAILGGNGRTHSRSDHDRRHEDNHEDDQADSAHSHDRHDSRSGDHNLWSAYLHVLADALTSFMAIFALLGAKYLGQNWLDPFMGMVGALLVVRWSWGFCAPPRAFCLTWRPRRSSERRSGRPLNPRVTTAYPTCTYGPWGREYTRRRSPLSLPIPLMQITTVASCPRGSESSTQRLRLARARPVFKTRSRDITRLSDSLLPHRLAYTVILSGKHHNSSSSLKSADSRHRKHLLPRRGKVSPFLASAGIVRPEKRLKKTATPLRFRSFRDNIFT